MSKKLTKKYWDVVMCLDRFADFFLHIDIIGHDTYDDNFYSDLNKKAETFKGK